ncbi:hypothetical protein SAMN05444166_4392 [Singulisphaera sp. GP187]|uniref:hypothetical protein n=1 Tax=Singulisphaera sp. GP187 TaxID=1882752 RepID=UPI00092837CA|nr:hypothetical protein [Singulisphaera sp. GP187]SIO40080.1 hypothetical protein SAMN05444166_4392 [Singulisphaera sp. GP187]
MKRWLSRYVPTSVIALGLTLLALAPSSAQSVPPQRGTPPAEKKQAAPPIPAPAPAPALEPQDDPWEERKTRAREDFEYLEALRKAKLAECHEAEMRNSLALVAKTDMDRQKLKGFLSTFAIRQTEMTIAENQAQLEIRRVELKDIEIRLARTQRRLKAVERSAAISETETVQTQTDDRVRELEIKCERLRRESEFAERMIATLRIEVDILMKKRP